MELINASELINVLLASSVIGAISTFGITKALLVHVAYINKRIDITENDLKKLQEHVLTCVVNKR